MLCLCFYLPIALHSRVTIYSKHIYVYLYVYTPFYLRTLMYPIRLKEYLLVLVIACNPFDPDRAGSAYRGNNLIHPIALSHIRCRYNINSVCPNKHFHADDYPPIYMPASQICIRMRKNMRKYGKKHK